MMNLIERNLKYFIENHGDIYESYQEYGKSIDKDGGPLDEKTRRLIKVAISATIQNEYSLKTHIKKALRNGCTIKEVEHAILLVAPTVGFPAMMKALISIREEIGEETNPRDQNGKDDEDKKEDEEK